MKQTINNLFTALLVLILSPVAVLIVILAKVAFKDFKPKRKRIYISGKINGLPTHYYTQKFAQAEVQVQRFYSDNTISPLRIRPLFGIKRYWCYMFSDIVVLFKCDAVAFMDNWKDSRGARIEMVVALIANKEIIML